MVTGSFGTEEDSNETSSKNCFIKYVVGPKIKGSELNCRCNMKKMWMFGKYLELVGDQWLYVPVEVSDKWCTVGICPGTCTV